MMSEPCREKRQEHANNLGPRINSLEQPRQRGRLLVEDGLLQRPSDPRDGLGGEVPAAARCPAAGGGDFQAGYISHWWTTRLDTATRTA